MRINFCYGYLKYIYLEIGMYCVASGRVATKYEEVLSANKLP